MCVFLTDMPYIAEIAKDVLADEGIRAVVINKKDVNYHFGDIELYVERDFAVRAKHMLTRFNSDEGRILDEDER